MTAARAVWCVVGRSGERETGEVRADVRRERAPREIAILGELRGRYRPWASQQSVGGFSGPMGRMARCGVGATCGCARAPAAGPVRPSKLGEREHGIGCACGGRPSGGLTAETDRQTQGTVRVRRDRSETMRVLSDVMCVRVIQRRTGVESDVENCAMCEDCILDTRRRRDHPGPPPDCQLRVRSMAMRFCKLGRPFRNSRGRKQTRRRRRSSHASVPPAAPRRQPWARRCRGARA